MSNQKRIEELQSLISSHKKYVAQLEIDTIFAQDSEDPNTLIRVRFITSLKRNILNQILEFEQELNSLL